MQEVEHPKQEATQDTVQVDLPKRAGADNRKVFGSAASADKSQFVGVFGFAFCARRHCSPLFPLLVLLLLSVLYPLLSSDNRLFDGITIFYFLFLYIYGVLRSILICCIFSENSQILILSSLTLLEPSKARSQDSCQTIIIESQQQYEMRIMICESAL